MPLNGKRSAGATMSSILSAFTRSWLVAADCEAGRVEWW